MKLVWSGGQEVARCKLGRLESADAARAPLAVRPGGPAAAAHLLGCLELALCDPSELDQLDEEYSPAAGHYIITSSRLAPARAQELHAAARYKLAALCTEELDRLPSRRAEDVEQLAAPPGNSDAGTVERRALALRFRARLKAMLEETLAMCQA